MLPRLENSLRAWGKPEFEAVLKMEIEQMDASQLPLQQGLSGGSRVADSPFTALVYSVAERGDVLQVRAGILYQGVIAGCSCADDPTPASELNEYCEVWLAIDRSTAATSVTLAN